MAIAAIVQNRTGAAQVILASACCFGQCSLPNFFNMWYEMHILQTLMCCTHALRLQVSSHFYAAVGVWFGICGSVRV